MTLAVMVANQVIKLKSSLALKEISILLELRKIEKSRLELFFSCTVNFSLILRS